MEIVFWGFLGGELLSGSGLCIIILTGILILIRVLLCWWIWGEILLRDESEDIGEDVILTGLLLWGLLLWEKTGFLISIVSDGEIKLFCFFEK